MNESFEKIEKDLASLRPRPLSRELVERLGEELDRDAPLRLADRVLASFVGAGALAACVIVGVVTWNVIGQSSVPPPAASIAQTSVPSLAQYQQMLARGSSSSLPLGDPLSATR